MIDGLFDCRRTEHATALLDEVINSDMKLSYKKFDAIMLRLSAVGDLGAIHRLSEHMRRFLQCCDVETICNHSEEEHRPEKEMSAVVIPAAVSCYCG
jgi:hypothetical protein